MSRKNKTVTPQQIKALPLKDNGFYFYKCNLFYNERMFLKNDPSATQETTRFEHMHIPDVFVSFVDDTTIVSSQPSPIILNDNKRQTTFD